MHHPIAPSRPRRVSPWMLVGIAHAVGCGAPTTEDLDLASATAPLTVSAPGAVFERSALAMSSAGVDQSASVAIVGASGSVVRWGTMIGYGAAPVVVPGVTQAVSVTTSSVSSCALRVDGTVWCWTPYGAVPAPVPALASVVAIAQGAVGQHCAIRSDRTVWCWGTNTYGELGDGSTEARPLPVRVALDDATQLSMRGYNACARLASGVVWCWGLNGGGQVGDGSTLPRRRPVVVPLFNVASVQVGEGHTCAVLGTGRVACWGRNGHGQLGDGTYTDHATPVIVPGLEHVVAVAPGSQHTCALTDAGETWCWGFNGSGALGALVPFSGRYPTPMRAAVGFRFVALSAGDQTTCGRTAEGRLWCWGSNRGQSMGQPAEFTYTQRPYEVTGAW